MTIGDVARRMGEDVRPWMVRRVFEKGLLPPAERLGPYRVFVEADLPPIRAALVNCGYLPERETATAR
jgi:DNA-binding transcriptional MerR regulator